MLRFTPATLSALLFICLSSSAAHAQQTSSPYPGQPPTSGPWNAEEQRLNAQLRDSIRSLGSGPAGPSNFPREYFDSFFLPRDFADRREDLLRPTQAERAPYATFLKQPHTGLVKLVPQSARAVSVKDLLKTKKANQTPAMFPGGGAFYSFIFRDHSPDIADLKLRDGQFEVGFSADVLAGIVVLGDAAVDSLTTASPGVQTLAQYERPARRKQAIAEHDQLKRGITIADYRISTAAPVRDNTTYAFRSIAYGRSDHLIVFRIVKQNADGSVLLLWKRIAKLSPPKLKK